MTIASHSQPASLSFHRPSEIPSEPLAIDHWLASSLLQKAIRRGDADLAASAALTLFRARGTAIWRRFLVIAFEDVSVGCIEAVCDTVTLATDRSARLAAGDEAAVVACLARRLAYAPKDRSTDYLMGAAQHHPELEAAREQAGTASLTERIAMVSNPGLPLPIRALVAWYVSGLDRVDEKRLGRADLVGLLKAYRMLGVSDRLVNATALAAKRTREPITILLPLIEIATRDYGRPFIRSEAMRHSPQISGIPAYTFDKHTRIGKRSISILVRENDEVRTCLEEHLPEFRHLGATAVAAFYSDASPVLRRLAWNQSETLERMGMEGDMAREGVPLSGVLPIVEAVRANLDHLDKIRARLFLASRPASGGV